MKYIIGMIVVFVGLYIILYYDVFGLFAHSWVFNLSIILAVTMTLTAVILLKYLEKTKGGKKDKN